MAFRDFTVSALAVAGAKSCGVKGNIQARVLRMAKRSAPFTHPLGNRRFEQFVLRIANDEVMEVHVLPDQP